MCFIEELKAIAAFDDTSREYEKRITKFAREHMSREEIDAFRAVMDDPASGCSYEAFYCLATIYRHQKDFSRLCAIVSAAEQNEGFQCRASLKHIRIMYETHSESLYDYEAILRLAHESACELPDNSGYQHTFANAFATICENCLQEDLASIVDEWYDSALYCVNRAIELEKAYAKYYSTKARIVALKHHFAEADRLILQAIDLEDSTQKDYPLLVGNYQYYRAMNAIKKQQWLLQANLLEKKRTEQAGDKTVSGSYHTMHSYAFISYSHSDRTIVNHILEKFRKHDINFWYDGELPGGSDWTEEIGQKLLDCQVMFVFLSHTALWSKNVRNEISMAQNHQKQIVPIYIEKVDLSPGAELQLQSYHYFNFHEMSEDVFIHRLMASTPEVVLYGAAKPESGSPKKETTKGISKTRSEGRIEILQQLCESKTGIAEWNEDIIVVNDFFIAVFDGATSKNEATFQGMTGGRLAAQFLADYLCQDTFVSVSNVIDGKTAVCRMQAALKRYAKEHRLEEQGVHMTASGVIYSIAKHQIWSVGDCQFMIDGTAYTFPKKVDRILSEARALSIHMFLNSGFTEAALREDDKGRGVILDELKMQYYLENQPGEYGYTVFSSRGELQTIVIRDVLPGSEIVLASDGYPVLYGTLEESEYHLRELLQNDPLCYKEFKSTKGLTKGNPFVDDRAYIRFRVNE